MSERLRRFLSHDCTPFEQFLKYGAIGAMATCVQAAVFYFLAASVLRCLKADDWAVRLVGLPSAEVTDAVRGLRFGIATGLGFVFSNLFCWVMNRLFVFRGGKFAWYKELGLFLGVSGLAMFLATVLSSWLIAACSMMTTLAVLVEIVVSFLFNYVLRKFFIFKG